MPGFAYSAVSGSVSAGSGSDGSTGTSSSTTDARNQVFNGTGWDRLRGGFPVSGSNVTSSNGAITNWQGVGHVAPFARYHLTRSVIPELGGSVFNSNQRGDITVAEQFIPSYEDNANGIAHTQERAIGDSLGAWTLYSSGATRVGTVGISLKATAGRIRKIGATNVSGGTNFWIVIVNKATAPVNGDAAVWAFPLTHTGSVSMSFGGSPGASLDFPGGLHLGTGIAYAVSTIPEKVNLPAISDCTVFAEYA